MRRAGRPTAVALRVATVTALMVLLGACSGEPAPSAELVAVPTQSPPPPFQLGPQACPAALLEGTLVRHEEAGLAVRADRNLPPTPVVWPHGWAARDVGGVRELLDADGRVVGREGDVVSAGGGAYAPRDWFHPCGPIDFRRAD